MEMFIFSTLDLANEIHKQTIVVLMGAIFKNTINRYAILKLFDYV